MWLRARGVLPAAMSLLLLAGCTPQGPASPASGKPAQSQVAKRISLDEAYKLIQQHKDDAKFVILDVRTPKEYADGHIPQAINLDYYVPDYKARLDKLAKDRIYLIHCAIGGRSLKTLKLMKRLNFQEVYEFKAGFRGWKSAGYLTEKF